MIHLRSFGLTRAEVVGVTLAVLAVLVTLLVAVASCGCACPPRPEPMPPLPAWAEYTRTRPQYRNLSPDADHPGWRGRGQVCGAGKCG